MYKYNWVTGDPKMNKCHFWVTGDPEIITLTDSLETRNKYV